MVLKSKELIEQKTLEAIKILENVSDLQKVKQKSWCWKKWRGLEELKFFQSLEKNIN